MVPLRFYICMTLCTDQQIVPDRANDMYPNLEPFNSI